MATQNNKIDVASLKVGDELTATVKCDNNKCVTNNEPMPSRFIVVSTSPLRLRCHYCDHELEGDNIQFI